MLRQWALRPHFLRITTMFWRTPCFCESCTQWSPNKSLLIVFKFNVTFGGFQGNLILISSIQPMTWKHHFLCFTHYNNLWIVKLLTFWFFILLSRNVFKLWHLACRFGSQHQTFRFLCHHHFLDPGTLLTSWMLDFDLVHFHTFWVVSFSLSSGANTLWCRSCSDTGGHGGDVRFWAESSVPAVLHYQLLPAWKWSPAWLWKVPPPYKAAGLT